MRVHELAAELGTTSAVIIDTAATQGFDVTTASSGLTDTQADVVRTLVKLTSGIQSPPATTPVSNNPPTPTEAIAAKAAAAEAFAFQPPDVSDVVLPVISPLPAASTTDATPVVPASAALVPATPAPVSGAAGSVPEQAGGVPTATEPPPSPAAFPTLPPPDDSPTAWSKRWPAPPPQRNGRPVMRKHSTTPIFVSDVPTRSDVLDKTGKPAVCIFAPEDTDLELDVYGAADVAGPFLPAGQVEVSAGTVSHLPDGLVTACPYVVFVSAEPVAITVSCLG